MSSVTTGAGVPEELPPELLEPSDEEELELPELVDEPDELVEELEVVVELTVLDEDEDKLLLEELELLLEELVVVELELEDEDDDVLLLLDELDVAVELEPAEELEAAVTEAPDELLAELAEAELAVPLAEMLLPEELAEELDEWLPVEPLELAVEATAELAAVEAVELVLGEATHAPEASQVNPAPHGVLELHVVLPLQPAALSAAASSAPVKSLGMVIPVVRIIQSPYVLSRVPTSTPRGHRAACGSSSRSWRRAALPLLATATSTIPNPL